MTAGNRHDELGAVVARKLHALRNQRQLSLEHLARLSGVSRAMLWQIESERSAPTLKLLSRVAEALGVTISALLDPPERVADVEVLRADQAKWLRSSDGSYLSRALFPFEGSHAVEFYEIRLEPGGAERAEAHENGTLENLVVAEGTVEIDVADTTFALGRGDALQFRADVAHAYRNPGTQPAVIYLVMTHPTERHYG